MIRCCAPLVSLVLVFCAATEPPLRLVAVGRYDFSGGDDDNPRLRADGLSGLAYLGDDQYLAVSDRHATLHRLAIRIDPETGGILTAAFGAPLQLKDARCQPFPEPEQGPDREGIAYDPRSESVLISNERTGTDQDQPSLARHSIETGCLIDELRVPAHRELEVYGKIRRNLGFEALARHADTGLVWTANEEALRVDGGRPTDERGTVVRLQKLDAALRPLAQYAYVVDPLPAPRPSGGLWSSGLADFVALPRGRLLVLERALVGVVPPLGTARIRLYEVAVAAAAPLDGEALEGLEKHHYNPAAKSLLAELVFGIDSNSNFEGVALGPRLRNGEYSVVLIADNDVGAKQSLYTLRLSGLTD